MSTRDVELAVVALGLGIKPQNGRGAGPAAEAAPAKDVAAPVGAGKGGPGKWFASLLGR